MRRRLSGNCEAGRIRQIRLQKARSCSREGNIDDLLLKT